ncbi:MAG TPA: hypothetical protein VIL36_06510 [Acidimicrobiales bacterium]
MNTAEARRFIELRLQPDTDPVLTADEVETLLPYAQATDAAGREPCDPDWEPTYSVAGCHYAIAEGWNIKYAKAAERYSFTTDSQTFTVNQLLDHCAHMARKHLAKVQTSTPTGGRR